MSDVGDPCLNGVRRKTWNTLLSHDFKTDISVELNRENKREG